MQNITQKEGDDENETQTEMMAKNAKIIFFSN